MKPILQAEFPLDFKVIKTNGYIVIDNNKIKVEIVWDTGTTNCGISQKLAKKFCLKERKGIETKVIGGKKTFPSYKVGILIGDYLFTNQTILGVDTEDFDVLIGMGIIKQGSIKLLKYKDKFSFLFFV